MRNPTHTLASRCRSRSYLTPISIHLDHQSWLMFIQHCTLQLSRCHVRRQDTQKCTHFNETHHMDIKYKGKGWLL